MSATETPRIAIVVHVYKKDLVPNEVISLTQLTKILASWPVVITAPDGLALDAYKDILGDQLAEVIYFPSSYFASLHGYNQLLLHRVFYAKFLAYDYILLHHTDAFVFRDELLYWAGLSLDNIGAPAYEYDGTMHPVNFIAACNGGLCLRKVNTFYSISESNVAVYKYSDILTDFNRYNWKGKIARAFYYLKLLITAGARMRSGRNSIRENEDVIWGYYVPAYIPEFRNATFHEGLKFSMEFNCDVLLAQNGNELPFGCHGWYKPMFIDFWKPYIEAQGYKVE